MTRSLRDWGWLLWLTLLPWAPFIIGNGNKLDLWHEQMMWGHAGLIILTFVGMVHGTRPIPNLPLAVWLGWVSLLTLVIWNQAVPKFDRYSALYVKSVGHLMGLGHVLTVGVLWAAFTSQWTKANVSWLWKLLTYAAVVHVAYGVLQLWQWDQFFHSNDPAVATDTLVGMLGNPNHYGAWLVMTLPLFLLQEKRWWLGMAVITIILILMTKSVGAVGAMFAGLLWWTLANPTWKRCSGLASLLLLTIFLGIAFADDVTKDSGRIQAYTYYWHIFEQRAITGFGPGMVGEIAKQITNGPMVGWRHCHQEMLQMLVEQGIVGGLLVLWLVGETLKRAWQVRRNLLGAACGAGFVATLANAMVNFPFHLSAVAIPCALMAMTCWILSETPETGEAEWRH